MNLLEKSKTNAQSWLTPAFDAATQETVRQLLERNPEELIECFHKNLEFGTGGMRGIMGIGTNRMNRYTLGKNTQGLSNYLKKVYPNEQVRVAIAYDCRHNSQEFAKIVADVFSANGIKVFLFSELRPTPELSFAIRFLKCHSGVVLTASYFLLPHILCKEYSVYYQQSNLYFLFRKILLSACNCYFRHTLLKVL